MPTLHDGTEVASDSEAWRMECLASHLACKTPAEQAAWLMHSAVLRKVDIRTLDPLADLADKLRGLFSARTTYVRAGVEG